MITLRLNSELEKRIENISKTTGITKSELIRKSVIEYIDKIQNKDAWELGKDLFGKHKSGRNDLSTSAKSIFRDKLKNKMKK